MQAIMGVLQLPYRSLTALLRARIVTMTASLAGRQHCHPIVEWRHTSGQSAPSGYTLGQWEWRFEVQVIIVIEVANHTIPYDLSHGAGPQNMTNQSGRRKWISSGALTFKRAFIGLMSKQQGYRAF
jgi:hypothetical protein